LCKCCQPLSLEKSRNFRLSLPIVDFVAAMVIGMLGYELWQRRGVAKSAPGPLVATPSDG